MPNFFFLILLLFLSKILDENSLLMFLLVNYKKIFSIQCFFFFVWHPCMYICVCKLVIRAWIRNLWSGGRRQYDGNVQRSDRLNNLHFFLFIKRIYIYTAFGFEHLLKLKQEGKVSRDALAKGYLDMKFS